MESSSKNHTCYPICMQRSHNFSHVMYGFILHYLFIYFILFTNDSFILICSFYTIHLFTYAIFTFNLFFHVIFTFHLFSPLIFYIIHLFPCAIFTFNFFFCMWFVSNVIFTFHFRIFTLFPHAIFAWLVYFHMRLLHNLFILTGYDKKRDLKRQNNQRTWTNDRKHNFS